jgi:NADH-quinone oxidoreductase subunit L
MLNLVWLVPILPFAGYVILALFGRHISPKAVALIGIGFTALSAIITLLIAFSFIASPPPGYSYSQTLWNWIAVGEFACAFSLFLDPLSIIFTVVITFVGSLILLYSAEYMEKEEGYSRFFAYMNLFIGSMLCLVLSDNMLFMYLGWEGVGLCSYLLIGFFYRDPANGLAARKAFIVTRIGDTSLAIGLFLLFSRLGTLRIPEMLERASHQWEPGTAAALAASLLLLGGAVGKSAQIPLQTWLPDAMAGPTPVSALIHAATMVTAGVYLIARTHTIFELSPTAMALVAVIGAVTLLISGLTGITQTDIKRVLAYSTISQIGYMFLALGVGAWAQGVFHFMVHAFFKALLFLGAGVVILAMHHEQDILKMGGLRKQLPLTFWTFLIGSGALSAFPFVTAGFYSKDAIIWHAWSSDMGGFWLGAAALIGALLTSIYTFRMIFLVFLGKAQQQIAHSPGLRLQLPLVVLAFLSVCAGFLNLPEWLGRFTPFSNFLSHALPEVRTRPELANQEWIIEAITIAFALSGIWLAYLLFFKHRRTIDSVERNSFGNMTYKFVFSGWGFDWLYHRFLIQPYIWISNINRDDVIDNFYSGLARLVRLGYSGLSASETGNVRLYAALIASGVLIALAVMAFL